MVSRFTHSKQFTQTNLSFGHNPPGGKSTYMYDFSTDPRRLCPLRSRMERSKVSASQMELAANQSKDAETERKKTLGRTHFTFGNDARSDSTAYTEFAAIPPDGSQVRVAVQPPKTAEVFPSAHHHPHTLGTKSTIKNDYSYFGHGALQTIYGSRRDELNTVKGIHTRDSVGAALQCGKARKILTRSMMDYRPPMDRLSENMREIVVNSVAPAVRGDSIWSSVNSGGPSAILSEMRHNYGWPLASNVCSVKRFYRGHMNKVR